MVSGGPMLAGQLAGRTVDLNTVFEAVGRHMAGTLDDEGLKAVECKRLPHVRLVLGLVHGQLHELPGRGHRHGAARQRHHSGAVFGEVALCQGQRRAADAGARANIRPRDIVTEAAIGNALAADASLGCSTNTVLHLAAVAAEAELEFPLQRINEIAARVPQLCHLAPSGPHHMQDLYQAGGVQALVHQLVDAGLMDGGAKTVAAATLAEAVAGASVADAEVIRPLKRAYNATGGLAVLFRQSGAARCRGQGGRRRQVDAAPPRAGAGV